MIDNITIEKHLNAHPDIELAEVSGDGYHYELIVVSSLFSNLNKVKRQQTVYALLKDWITSGSLHAVSMTTYTPEEWENKNG